MESKRDLGATSNVKLWYIHQSNNRDYDTFDSAVVAAVSEDEARYTHPDGNKWDGKQWGRSYGFADWVRPDEVQVVHIGEAKEGTEAGVICASFNAG